MGSQDLKFVICPTNRATPEYQQLADEIFSFWKKVWTDTFKELGIEYKGESDSFVNSDFATAVFCQNEIVSVSLFKIFNTQSESFPQYSYFQKWSNHIADLKDEKKIFNCTYFCVAPKWRHHKFDGFSSKQLNLIMLLKTFVNTDINYMAATPRRDRNMHSLLYEWGGLCLQENIPSGYGDTVDLVLYKKANVIEALNRIPHVLIERLWKSRTVAQFDLNDFEAMKIYQHYADNKRKVG